MSQTCVQNGQLVYIRAHSMCRSAVAEVVGQTTNRRQQRIVVRLVTDWYDWDQERPAGGPAPAAGQHLLISAQSIEPLQF